MKMAKDHQCFVVIFSWNAWRPFCPSLGLQHSDCYFSIVIHPLTPFVSLNLSFFFNHHKIILLLSFHHLWFALQFLHPSLFLVASPPTSIVIFLFFTMWELIHYAINMWIRKCGQEFKLELLCEKMVGLWRECARFHL